MDEKMLHLDLTISFHCDHWKIFAVNLFNNQLLKFVNQSALFFDSLTANG